MTEKELLEAIPLYVLGLLDEAETREMEERLSRGSPELTAELRRHESIAAGLASSVPAAEPPEALRSRVLSGALGGDYFFALPEDARWEQASGKGARWSRLFTDTAAGRVSLVFQLEPGASLAGLPGMELLDFYVVSGEAHLGGLELGQGDYRLLSDRDRSAGVRSRSGMTAFVTAVAGRPLAATPERTLRASELTWTEVSPRCKVCPLSGGGVEGAESILFLLEPGAAFPEHVHETGAEEIYILSGSASCMGASMGVGGYHRAAGGSFHPVTTSDEGCIALVIHHHGAAA